MEHSISIIIPAWNEENIILKTTDFLRRLKLPFNYSELIYIAGGKDNTYEVCKQIKLNNFDKVITLKQLSNDFKTGALIKGLKEAKGDNIILIDADVFISPNLAIEISKSLKKFDTVCCDFIPMIKKGFWYDYYTLFKLIWAHNPNNLGSLIGGSTISLKKDVIKEVGIEELFSSKSTAGVDYYMGLVLKRHKKSIGFVKNTYVVMPRPNNLKDFYKDQKRWLNAFVTLHQEEKKLILISLTLNFLSCLFPPLIFLFNIKKMVKISSKKVLKIKYFIILFIIEYIINLQSFVTLIKNKAGKLKTLDHFKGEDRYY